MNGNFLLRTCKCWLSNFVVVFSLFPVFVCRETWVSFAVHIGSVSQARAVCFHSPVAERAFEVSVHPSSAALR